MVAGAWIVVACALTEVTAMATDKQLPNSV